MRAMRRKIVTTSSSSSNSSSSISAIADIVGYCTNAISDRNMGAIIGNYAKGLQLQQLKDFEGGYKQILKGNTILNCHYYY